MNLLRAYPSDWQRKLKLARSAEIERNKDVLDDNDSLEVCVVKMNFSVTPICSENEGVLLTATEYASQFEKGGYQHRFQDKCFLFLFLVTISAIFCLALDLWFSDIISSDSNLPHSLNRQILIALPQISIVSMILSTLCSIMILIIGKAFIWLSLISIAGTQLALAGTFLKEALLTESMIAYTASILMGLGALFFVVGSYLMRHRVDFACAHIRVAARAILSYPMALLGAVCMAVVQSFWSFIWILGLLRMLRFSKLATKNDCLGEECLKHVSARSAMSISIGMLVIYFWCSMVFRNILAVSIGSIVSSWKCKSQKNNLVAKAFLEAWTFHLGSICFGSLLVAVVETFRQVLSTLATLTSRQKNFYMAWVFSILSSVLHFVEYLMEFCNRFAYAYIGCYKCAFIPASKRSIQFLKSKGWSAVVNQEITRTAFWYANLLIGSLVAYITVRVFEITYSQASPSLHYRNPLVAVLGFTIGYLVTSIILSVISSAVTTVYILWAEEPSSWMQTRPDEYQILHNVWSKIFPDDYNSGCGASNTSLS